MEILAEKEIVYDAVTGDKTEPIRNTVITHGNFRMTVIITARMRDLKTPGGMFDLNQPMQR